MGEMGMRPTYESQKDRDNELSVQIRIEAWGNCELVKLPMQQHLDWEAYRGKKLVALMEYKKRTCTRLQYPTYMVASKKIQRGIYQSVRSGVPFIFFVEWTDGLHYLVIDNNTPMTVGSGGRSDRGDRFDQEKMCYFSTALFKRVSPQK